MGRMRTIKPEAFTSMTMAGLSIPARWCYAGLWTYLDDEGRGVDNPRLIKAAVYPLDDEISWQDVDGYLVEMVKHGHIERYEANGQRLIQVRRWDRHQHPNKPKPSLLPPPEPESPTIPGLEGTSSGAGRNTSGTATGTVPVGEGVVVGGERRGRGRGRPPRSATPIPDDFTLSDGSREYATKVGMSPDVGRRELRNFRNWHAAKGTEHKDWQAAWRTWVDRWADRREDQELMRSGSSTQRGTSRWGDTSV